MIGRVQTVYLAFLLVAICFFSGTDAQTTTDAATGQKKRKAHPQKVSMEQWAQSLSPSKDYVPEEWRHRFHSKSESTFFNEYSIQLSKIFKQNNAKVNFVMVGACDGTADKTIREIFLKHAHWRGVFVEPVEMNVRDLVKYLADHDVSQRSMVIRAAATLECAGPTISFERPLYEEKNASTPHWLRRQIGSIVPTHRDHAKKDWTIETVRCVTANDILQDWGSTTTPTAKSAAAKIASADAGGTPVAAVVPTISKQVRRRPHVLKIDAEGHDYEVLMSFVKEGTRHSELPLLIEFEAKSIGKKFPAAKEHMEKMGYAVSDFGADGFALLKADHIFD